MALTLMGDACAHIPAHANNGKSAYRQIGKAFRDGDRISIKIDTLPLPGCGWEGWVNIFPIREPLGPVPAFAGPIPPTTRIIPRDDDIPF